MELYTFGLYPDDDEPAAPAERERRRAQVLGFIEVMTRMASLSGGMPADLATGAAAIAAHAERLWGPDEMPREVADFVARHRLDDAEPASRTRAFQADAEAKDAIRRTLRPPPYDEADSLALDRLPERAVFFALQAALPDPTAVRPDEVILLPDAVPVPLTEAMRRVVAMPKPLAFRAEVRGGYMAVDVRPGDLDEWQFARVGHERTLSEVLPRAVRETGAPNAVLLRGAHGTLLLPYPAFEMWLLVYGGARNFRGDHARGKNAALAALVLDLSPRR